MVSLSTYFEKPEKIFEKVIYSVSLYLSFWRFKTDRTMLSFARILNRYKQRLSGLNLYIRMHELHLNYEYSAKKLKVIWRHTDIWSKHHPAVL
jgi:hypothetical protein